MHVASDLVERTPFFGEMNGGCAQSIMVALHILVAPVAIYVTEFLSRMNSRSR